jgi:uncharacterized protein YegJ (DUF2314 family)
LVRHKSGVLAALSGILLFIGACAPADKVVFVKDDDPEMVAAIAKARATLPLFWQVFDKHEHGENEFSLKVKITDHEGTEHFWASDIEKRDGRIWGTITNDPGIIASVKLGDQIEIPEANISDWFYMRDGKMVGNRTLVPLLRTLPPKEAAAYRNLLAEP